MFEVMNMVQTFNPEIIKYAIFDVDGTLYRKDIEYIEGAGTIQTAHDFFRFLAYIKNKEGRDTSDKISEELIEEYRKRSLEKSLRDAIAEVLPEDIEKYEGLVKQYGSNGKVFKGEFDTSSRYLHEMLKHIEFERILSHDAELVSTIDDLKSKGYKLGILTTEVYQTVDTVSRALGINLRDFEQKSGDKYKILCAENVKEKKPSPEGYRKLIELLDVESAREIVYIGDHFGKDIEASLRCGLQAIHVVTSGENSIEQVNVNGEMKEYARINGIYGLKDVL